MHALSSKIRAKIESLTLWYKCTPSKSLSMAKNSWEEQINKACFLSTEEWIYVTQMHFNMDTCTRLVEF